MKLCALVLLLATVPGFASPTLTDESGRTVVVSAQSHRIVSLVSSVVDDVYSPGAGADVMAVDGLVPFLKPNRLASRMSGSAVRIRRTKSLLKIPPSVALVSYMCIGYVDHFAPQPELETVGWKRRLSLKDALRSDTFDQPWVGAAKP
jgi:hypothetical protein